MSTKRDQQAAVIAEVLRLHDMGRLAIIDVSGDKPRNIDGAVAAVCGALRRAPPQETKEQR